MNKRAWRKNSKKTEKGYGSLTSYTNIMIIFINRLYHNENGSQSITMANTLIRFTYKVERLGFVGPK